MVVVKVDWMVQSKVLKLVDLLEEMKVDSKVVVKE